MIKGRVCAVTVLGASLLVTLIAAGGCADRDGASPGPAATPYDGPLRVEQTEPPDPDAPDQGGAAALALKCRGTPVGHNSNTGPHAGKVFPTPEAALRDALDGGPYKGPFREYRRAAESADRVLYRYEPDGAAKHALVAHHGDSMDGHTGWYVESEARCNAAEFPESVTRPTGVQIWTDARGVRVLTTEVISFRGAQHCNWEHMTFLVLGGQGPMGPAFVANADAELDEYFAEPYQENLPLPADAVDSGYHLGEDRLWFSPDGMRAYVGTPQHVALWPRTVQLLACA